MWEKIKFGILIIINKIYHWKKKKEDISAKILKKNNLITIFRHQKNGNK